MKADKFKHDSDKLKQENTSPDGVSVEISFFYLFAWMTLLPLFGRFIQ